MGFRLGRALGKVAGAGIRQLTGGRVRPTFQRPTRRVTQVQSGPFGFFGKRQVVEDFPQAPMPVPTAPGDLQLPQLGAACPVGFRINRSTYISRGGGTSRWGPAGTIIVHPKGSTCVKRRRRNVGNAKALRRALSRVRGFGKLAQRVMRVLGLGRRRGGRRALPAAGGTSIVSVD